MNYSIRECQPNDLKTLVELCQKHAEYERANYNPIGKVAELYKALFEAQPKLFCLIVEANEVIVGYASYTFDYSTWDAATFMYMDCLFLEENARGFGIGEAIIEKLKQIASTKSCINIQWHTPTFNEGAIKFYHRMGANSKEKTRFFLDI